MSDVVGHRVHGEDPTQNAHGTSDKLMLVVENGLERRIMPMLAALMGDSMRLKGKVALLTGAAAAIKGELMGFGGAVAHHFVREGAKVVLTDIRDDLGERAAAAPPCRWP
jgi:hypothetical protein